MLVTALGARHGRGARRHRARVRPGTCKGVATPRPLDSRSASRAARVPDGQVARRRALRRDRAARFARARHARGRHRQDVRRRHAHERHGRGVCARSASAFRACRTASSRRTRSRWSSACSARPSGSRCRTPNIDASKEPPRATRCSSSASPGLGYAYRWDFDGDGEPETDWSADSNDLAHVHGRRLPAGRRRGVRGGPLRRWPSARSILPSARRWRARAAASSARSGSASPTRRRLRRSSSRRTGCCVRGNGARLRQDGKTLTEPEVTLQRGAHVEYRPGARHRRRRGPHRRARAQRIRRRARSPSVAGAARGAQARDVRGVWRGGGEPVSAHLIIDPGRAAADRGASASCSCRARTSQLLRALTVGVMLVEFAASLYLLNGDYVSSPEYRFTEHVPLVPAYGITLHGRRRRHLALAGPAHHLHHADRDLRLVRTRIDTQGQGVRASRSCCSRRRCSARSSRSTCSCSTCSGS